MGFKKEIWNYTENNFRQVAERYVDIEGRLEFLESVVKECLDVDADGNYSLSEKSLDVLIEDTKRQIDFYREQANTYNYYAYAFRMYKCCEYERDKLKSLLILKDNLGKGDK